MHFMCGHSFNRSALGDAERECPLHAEEFRQIGDVTRSLLAGAGEQARSRLPAAAPADPATG